MSEKEVFMARKTFISYKYSECQDLRDKIIKALGDDATYYQGEFSDSPDMTDYTTQSIKNNLSDMIYGSSVTIVVLSPNMNQSKWIPWEIEYSLKCISRDDQTSHQNGIVAVIKKVNNSYDWFKSKSFDEEKGFSVSSYNDNLIPEIIRVNRYNSSPKKCGCKQCKKYDGISQCATGCSIFDWDLGSYISFVEEDDFLNNPTYYIDKAYNKSQHLEKFFTKKQIYKKQVI